MNLINKKSVIGGYVWAGNDTSDPDCYQDIYFWQAAYAYWGLSLYIKLCTQVRDEVKNLYKINLHRKLKSLEYRLSNQTRLLLIFAFNLLVFFIFSLSSNKFWDKIWKYLYKIWVYPLIAILCYFFVSAIFSLYYFYSDKLRSYLNDTSVKHKWINKLVFKTPLPLRPNFLSLLIIPIIIYVRFIKPVKDFFSKVKKH